MARSHSSCLLVLVASSLTTVDGPTIGAMVPSICSESELGKANALLGTVENVAMIVGPALGGVFVLLGSTSLAFRAERHHLLHRRGVCLRTLDPLRSGRG